jgi:hypothetical protein
MSTTMIQIISAIGAVVIFAIIIWRRTSKATK